VPVVELYAVVLSSGRQFGFWFRDCYGFGWFEEFGTSPLVVTWFSGLRSSGPEDIFRPLGET